MVRPPRTTQALLATLEEAKANVMKNASIMESTLLARFESFTAPKPSQLRIYRHGQYPGATVDGTFRSLNAGYSGGMRVDENALVDDHQSPLRANDYLEMRVQPQLEYYKSKLPDYEARSAASFEIRDGVARNDLVSSQLSVTVDHEAKRGASAVLLMLGSVAATGLAFADLANWSVIVTAFTSTVTAWSEFDSIAKKQVGSLVSRGFVSGSSFFEAIDLAVIVRRDPGGRGGAEQGRGCGAGAGRRGGARAGESITIVSCSGVLCPPPSGRAASPTRSASSTRSCFGGKACPRSTRRTSAT